MLQIVVGYGDYEYGAESKELRREHQRPSNRQRQAHNACPARNAQPETIKELQLIITPQFEHFQSGLFPVYATFLLQLRAMQFLNGHYDVGSKMPLLLNIQLDSP